MKRLFRTLVLMIGVLTTLSLQAHSGPSSSKEGRHIMNQNSSAIDPKAKIQIVNERNTAEAPTPYKKSGKTTKKRLAYNSSDTDEMESVSKEGEINYSLFDLFVSNSEDGSNSYHRCPFVAYAGDNEYIASYNEVGEGFFVRLKKGTQLYIGTIYSPGGSFRARGGYADLTEDNLVCNLEFWEANWDGYNIVSDVEGLYRVLVSYEGEKAKLTFKNVEDNIEDRQLYLRGEFNNWECDSDWKLIRDEETGLYHLDQKTIKGSNQFKIATPDWQCPEYGAYLELLDGEEVGDEPYFLGIGEAVPNLYGSFDGVYDITFDPKVPSLQFNLSTTPGPGADIDYSNYWFVCGGVNKVGYYTTPTENKNQFIVEDVAIGNGSYFYLLDGVTQNKYFAVNNQGVAFDSEDVSIELNYCTADDPNIYAVLWNGPDGEYDVTIDFDGETANIRFDKKGDLIFSPATVKLIDYTNNAAWYPYDAAGHTAKYTNLEFSADSDYLLLLSDYRSGKNFACTEDAPVISADNLTTYVSVDGEYYLIVADLEGVYDIIVEYNDDFTSADVTFSPVVPEKDFSSVYLITGDSSESYAPELTENGIVYRDIVIDGVRGFGLYWDGDVFGWPEDESKMIPATKNHPETKVYADPTYFASAILTGLFDVYVEFNENLTEASMKFVKTEDIYPYLTVKLENGASCTFRANKDGYTEISVDTNDEFWGISGYRFNGEDVELPSVSTALDLNVYVEEQKELLCYLEYLGECEVLGATTGSEVEFVDEVAVVRTAEGVEIHNVAEGEEICVYTLSGQIVTIAKAEQSDVSIKLEKGQTYIVRVGKNAVKVMM